MTGEQLLALSASPRRIGALASSMIVSGGPVHLSRNRWFTRTVHSDEGSGFTPLKADTTPSRSSTVAVEAADGEDAIARAEACLFIDFGQIENYAKPQ